MHGRYLLGQNLVLTRVYVTLDVVKPYHRRMAKTQNIKFSTYKDEFAANGTMAIRIDRQLTVDGEQLLNHVTATSMYSPRMSSMTTT